MRASLTAVRPPTSDQPNSPAVCNVTLLNAAGVKPSSALSKSSVIKEGEVPLSVNAKIKARKKNNGSLTLNFDGIRQVAFLPVNLSDDILYYNTRTNS